MTTYRVSFDRIGRRKNIRSVVQASTPDELVTEISESVRPFCCGPITWKR